jgi:dTDP-4-dehydrorhamnose reductase
MNILLLGAGGQLGHALQAVLPSMGQLVACDQAEIDFADTDHLAQALERYPAEVIVNAAAFTAVDKAEIEQALAHRVNARAPHILAEHARRTGAFLVHYSTDYVFDGEKPTPYLETDLANPQSVYGKTKRAGEEAVLQSGCRALIFRTSWVFSTHGGNFIKTILKLASERDALQVVADQFGAPTSAKLLADITRLALREALADRLPQGLYHLTPAGSTSWHGLASFVLSRAQSLGGDFKLGPAHIRPIPTEAYPLPARRPKNSRLDTSKLRAALGIELPDWQQDVIEVVDALIKTRTCP